MPNLFGHPRVQILKSVCTYLCLHLATPIYCSLFAMLYVQPANQSNWSHVISAT